MNPSFEQFKALVNETVTHAWQGALAHLAANPRAFAREGRKTVDADTALAVTKLLLAELFVAVPGLVSAAAADPSVDREALLAHAEALGVATITRLLGDHPGN